MKLDSQSSQVTVLSTVKHYSRPGVQVWNELHVKLTMQQYRMAQVQAFYILSQPSFQRLTHYKREGHRQSVVHGNLAETAVSVATGITSDVGDYHDGDLAGRIEVRTTELEDGCLLVRDTDKLERPFVFATGKELDWTIHGFQIGSWVKENGIMVGSDKYPCWICNNDDLYPIGGLINAYHNQNTTRGFLIDDNSNGN